MDVLWGSYDAFNAFRAFIDTYCRFHYRKVYACTNKFKVRCTYRVYITSTEFAEIRIATEDDHRSENAAQWKTVYTYILYNMARYIITVNWLYLSSTWTFTAERRRSNDLLIWIEYWSTQLEYTEEYSISFCKRHTCQFIYGQNTCVNIYTMYLYAKSNFSVFSSIPP